MSVWKEFKEFAFKGNVMDLAAAVIIGTAFTAVVTALVKNVLMPTLGYVLPFKGGYRAWKIGEIEIGVFLGEAVNFMLIALAMFVLAVKLRGILLKSPPKEAVTKECPKCASSISIKASRCPHCTSELPPG